jgi:hypothetical protein
MSKRKTNPAISTYRAIKKIRGDWGQINPVTKIIPNKKKNYIPDEYDEFYSMDDCARDCVDYYEEDDYIYAED